MGKSLNVNSALSGMLGLGIIIWVIVILSKGLQGPVSLDALKEIPTAIGWTTPILFWFSKWGWRWKIFRRWLVLVADLNGTWEGEFRSTWVNPETGKQVPPKKAYLVIQQSLFEINCCQLTKESKSYSRAAAIQSSQNGYMQILEFTFSNDPKVSVQHRSNSHEGACSLDIIDRPNRKLVGKYWTERATKGELEYKFLNLDLKQEF